MLPAGSRLLLSDPIFYVVSALAVTFLGLSKGGFLGLGLAATPLLALRVPPVQAAAILLPILLLQDVISVWAYRHHWDAWNLKVLLPGAVIGVAAAWLLAAKVPEAYVRLAVGLIAVVFVLTRWLGPTRTRAASPTWIGGLFWGALSAFTSALAHAGAPPFQVYVLPQRLDKLTFVGTSTIFFAATNLMKAAPYFALGQLTTENLAAAAVMLPLAVLTNFAGIWLVHRTRPELFFKIAYLMVFIIAIELIRAGLVTLIHG